MPALHHDRGIHADAAALYLCTLITLALTRISDSWTLAPRLFHPELGQLYATLTGLGQGLPWEGIYRARPRIRLTCPECGHGVHAKLSPRRVRYFAHDPGRSPHCQLSLQSADHHLLKRC
ncbi:hypothetical protein HD597_000650 [Nonomuraea thailandensis]|uniref:Uncharacterized protein n=1 Tax=Nonomuraea thailandensis TaxID=1188745 RepID=A0A9X2G9N8_9ACTN|nr:hypothetical protein [Nonomuraea thailandensis]MCP2353630.1 hypothetical protein [Nonomuraea thailandensis]